MKGYETSDIRNVAVIGGKGVGKTTFLEAALFAAKATTRQGKVADGTSLLDYDPLEIERRQSIFSKVTPLEWKKRKINFIDSPGYADFVGDMVGALSVADVALFVIDASHAVDVATKTCFARAKKYGKPVVFFVNHMDGERADFTKILDVLRQELVARAVLFQLPIGSGSGFKGIVDLIRMKGYFFEGGGLREGAIPVELEDQAKEQHIKLIEMVAERDEQLLEKYLNTGELDEAHLKRGVVAGLASGQLSPVFIGSALGNIGISLVLDVIGDYFPSPADVPPIEAKRPDGSTIKITPDMKGPLIAQIFKTTSDPGIGDIFFFRVYSGTMLPGVDVSNNVRKSSERIGHLLTMRGKERLEVERVVAGDIAAVAKLKETGVGDTLSTKGEGVRCEPIPFPLPIVRLAVHPKTKKDQDKLGFGLAKLTEIDPTFTYSIDKEFSETIVTAMGEVQIDVMMRKLRERYGVEIELGKPHVPYREAITRKAEKQGKYKRQTGGHGQYGDCWLRLEPLPHDGKFEFVNAIVGGAIPGKYIPAIEKGVRDAMRKGALAGYPVVDCRVTVFDGSYHDVDSSDMAFQIAASMAFKAAMIEAAPLLLEPVVDLEVLAPQECLGDLSSDISQRRGRVSGVESGVIRAKVPLAELSQYSANLKSITRGAGSYSMTFSHYEPVPANVAHRVIDEAKREREAHPTHH